MSSKKGLNYYFKKNTNGSGNISNEGDLTLNPPKQQNTISDPSQLIENGSSNDKIDQDFQSNGNSSVNFSNINISNPNMSKSLDLTKITLEDNDVKYQITIFM
jgi:hypothetical protein